MSIPLNSYYLHLEENLHSLYIKICQEIFQKEPTTLTTELIEEIILIYIIELDKKFDNMKPETQNLFRNYLKDIEKEL